MARASHHTFQVLTKRHGRMRSLLNRPSFQDNLAHLAPWPLANVWLGVSVEDQKRADIRIPALIDTPATVRFLSCEPLLGPVDILGLVFGLNGIDWVIVGGESGRGARPVDPAWVRSLRDQCTAAKVPFHFKQWGEWAPTGMVSMGYLSDPRERHVGDLVDEHGYRVLMRRVGKKAAGRELDGRTWDGFPERVP
jgi:protein gp37